MIENQNEIAFMAALGAQRRGLRVMNIVSVPFNGRVLFGLGATDLLPAVADTFYLVKDFQIQTDAGYVGIAFLNFTNNAGFSAGSWELVVNLAASSHRLYAGVFETDILSYAVNTHSAGRFQFTAMVFKVTCEV